MSAPDFTPEALREAAARKAGHDDFGSDSYNAALSPLLYSIEHEMQLNEKGRSEIHTRIVDALANRLTLVAWEKAHPDEAASPIEAPIIILGLPRTGSSILHETLAAAPGMRTPLIWEVRDFSLVHDVSDAHADARIQEIEAAIARKNEAVPGYAAIHYENPHIPMECVALTIVDLVSTQFSTIAWAPTYRAFLLDHDMAETYRWHRRGLRFLQTRTPGRRWVLKAPMHSLYLARLLETYPDAVLVQTHREPMKVVGSFCSLCVTLRAGWSDCDGNNGRAAQDAGYAAQLVSRAVDFRAAHNDRDGRFHDVPFKRFMSDPQATLAAIFAHCGMDFTPETRRATLGYLESRPRTKHGKHSYDLEQFGLTPEAIEALFADYIGRYGAYL
jgi:hypothetical protein